MKQKNSYERASALARLNTAWHLWQKSWTLPLIETTITASLPNCEWNKTLKSEWDNAKKNLKEFEDFFEEEMIDAAKQLTEVVMKERGYKVIYEENERA